MTAKKKKKTEYLLNRIKYRIIVHSFFLLVFWVLLSPEAFDCLQSRHRLKRNLHEWRVNRGAVFL